MNIKILIAGCLALFVVFGHFVFGIKWYLKPMMNSNMEKVPKATMQSVFHYVSVFLVLSGIFLILIGLGKIGGHSNNNLVEFIGVNYMLFALVQIFYSFRNKIENPLITMFQWTMFFPIGILCLI